MANHPDALRLLVLAGWLGWRLLSPASAQTDLSALSGTVVDPSGKPVPGAAVTLKNRATQLERTALTGEQGRFVFSLLPPGSYTL